MGKLINDLTLSTSLTSAMQLEVDTAGTASWKITLGAIQTFANSGAWAGTKIGLALGGTNADLSATGGTSRVLRQSSLGAAITVSQLAASDLSAAVFSTAVSGPSFTPTATTVPANGVYLDSTGLVAVSQNTRKQLLIKEDPDPNFPASGTDLATWLEIGGHRCANTAADGSVIIMANGTGDAEGDYTIRLTAQGPNGGVHMVANKYIVANFSGATMADDHLTYINFSNADNGQNPAISAQKTYAGDSDAYGLTFYTAGTGGFGFYSDNAATKSLAINRTASAVNNLTIAPSATLNAVTLGIEGTDTNVSLRIAGKGTGATNIKTTGTNDDAASGDVGFYTSCNSPNSTATVTVTIAAPAVMTWTAHGLNTGSVVNFTTTGALPTGLATGTNYYVIPVNANTFNLATSAANAIAGTKITTTGSQSGTHTGLSRTANMVTNTPVNAAALALPAGDFDVWANGGFFGDTTTGLFNAKVSISTTSATHHTTLDRMGQIAPSTSTFGNGDFVLVPAGATRVTMPAGGGNIYLVVQASFGTSFCYSFGKLLARARR